MQLAAASPSFSLFGPHQKIYFLSSYNSVLKPYAKFIRLKTMIFRSSTIIFLLKLRFLFRAVIFQTQTKIIRLKTRTPASIFLLRHYFSTAECRFSGSLCRLFVFAVPQDGFSQEGDFDKTETKLL